MRKFIFIAILLNSLSCSSQNESTQPLDPLPEKPPSFYFGADLSYINEMEDCEAIYKDKNDVVKDPYLIFKDAGANLVRLRLWHNPSWTNYSNYEDVK
ncbi:MAG: arabinogalactan endo-1,4-beta-galactosidase, partial [Bacteroidetes bacterium]